MPVREPYVLSVHQPVRTPHLAELLTPLRQDYNFIIIDTNPYLGLLTINVLAACDEVIIPVSPQLWSATGLTDLMQTIFKVKRKINPSIDVAGILMTICNERARLFRDTKKRRSANRRSGVFAGKAPNFGPTWSC